MSFKDLNAQTDIKVRRSVLNQLVDVVQEDISGSATRRKYQVFVTGGVGPGVTSSLFQTVYDTDHTLSTANPIFDLTVGVSTGSLSVTVSQTTVDAAGKRLFPSNSLMMREKIDVYRQYAKSLLGSADSIFSTPVNSSTTADQTHHALFISFKRLFARDKVKKETFAMRMFRSASQQQRGYSATEGHNIGHRVTGSGQGPVIITDIGAATNTEVVFGGEVASLVNAANTSENLGLIFYDHGTIVLDADKVISGTQYVTGTIDAVANATLGGITTGQSLIGSHFYNSAAARAKFIPDFFVSASIDNIVDHFARDRFGSTTSTAFTFQNETRIHSQLIFCRADADSFNFSSNPTFTDANGRLRCIETGQEGNQRSFTFPTTIGLYNNDLTLLAVAKLSRPVEKNDERDLTFRVRLDF